MLAECVDALVSSIQIELYRSHLGSPAEAEPTGNLHRRDVSKQGFVAIIGQYAPLLVVRHIEDARLLVELDFVWLLRHSQVELPRPRMRQLALNSVMSQHRWSGSLMAIVPVL